MASSLLFIALLDSPPRLGVSANTSHTNPLTRARVEAVARVDVVVACRGVDKVDVDGVGVEGAEAAGAEELV